MPTCGRSFIAYVDDAFEECAGCQNDAFGFKNLTISCDNASHLPVSDLKVFNGVGQNRKILRGFEFCLHSCFIKAAVTLRARAANGGAFGPIKQAELNT